MNPIHPPASSAADPIWRSPLSTERHPTAAINFRLLDINDDCIYDIMRNLSLEELASVACVSTRLRDLARQLFVSNKANMRYRIDYNLDCDLYKRENESIPVDNGSHYPISSVRWNRLHSVAYERRVARIKCYLAAFGDLIEDVDYQYSSTLIRHTQTGELTSVCNGSLSRDIIKHCSTLKRLTVRNVVWTEAVLAEVCPLLRRLTTFHSIGSKNTKLILPALRMNCVDLNITGETCKAVFGCNFPKLQRFTYVDSESRTNYSYKSFIPRRKELLREFLLRHKNLHELQLDVKKKFYKIVLDQMPHLNVMKRLALSSRRFPLSPAMASLESLTLYAIKLDGGLLARLIDLPHLKHLKLDRVEFNANTTDAQLNTLQTLNRLESLEMNTNCVLFTQTFLDNLGSTNTLRSLHLQSTFGFNIDVQSIDRFTNLERLELVNCEIDFGENDQLSQLQHVKELRLIGIDTDTSTSILSTLGAVDMLEKLHISRSEVNGNTVTAFRRFRNLRELQLDGAWTGWGFDTMLVSLDLGNLWKLSLAHQTFNDIIQLAHRSIAITHVAVAECRGMPEKGVFDELQQKCREQNRRLIIEIQEYENSDLPAFVEDHDDIGYVEIRYK